MNYIENKSLKSGIYSLLSFVNAFSLNSSDNSKSRTIKNTHYRKYITR